MFSEKEQNLKEENASDDNQKVKDEETNKDDDEEDIEPEPETTLYVKNLNFDSTEESIKKVCNNRKWIFNHDNHIFNF